MPWNVLKLLQSIRECLFLACRSTKINFFDFIYKEWIAYPVIFFIFSNLSLKGNPIMMMQMIHRKLERIRKEKVCEDERAFVLLLSLADWCLFDWGCESKLKYVTLGPRWEAGGQQAQVWSTGHFHQQKAQENWWVIERVKRWLCLDCNSNI